MRRMLLIAALAMCGVAATGSVTTAALAQENEYELNLPGAGGGSVDPSARSNDRPEASGDSEPAPVQATPSVAPAPIDPEVGPAGEQREGQRPESERSLAEQRYPRGETYTLGPAEQAAAVPTAIPTDDGKGTPALAIVAAAAGLLILAAAWRLWTRDSEEGG